MPAKKNFISMIMLISLTTEIVYADIIMEYSQLLYQLKNYNTVGFFIIKNKNEEMIGQRGPLQSTGNILDLVPQDKDFFRLINSQEKQHIYSRIGIFHIDPFGRIINVDGYLLYPLIQLNNHRPNRLSVKGSKLIVEYLDEETPSSEIFDLHLYWPRNLTQGTISGQYFLFQETEKLIESDIVSGFVEHSGVNVPSVAAQMISLVGRISKHYGKNAIFSSGSSDASLAILSSILTASLIYEEYPDINNKQSNPIKLPSDWFLKAIEENPADKKTQNIKNQISIYSQFIEPDPLQIGQLDDFLEISLSE